MTGRQFLYRGAILILLLLGLDLVVGMVFSSLFSKVKSGSLYTSRYGWELSHEDIVIIGASEVAHSFISNQISSELGMSCYNLGMDGHNVYYQYGLLEAILSRYVPKCIIISPHIIEESTRSIEGLFPYYDKFENAKQIVHDVDKSMKYKLLANSFKYNSLIIKLIQGGIVKESDNNGYVPLYSKNQHPTLDTLPYNFGSSERTLKYFTKMLSLAKNSGARVFVIDVPVFQYCIKSEEYHAVINISYSVGVDVITFINDTIFLSNASYFKDKTHLNDYGAKVFTENVIDSLSTYLGAR